MSSLEKYQSAVRSGLHPETAKAFEPKPPVLQPEVKPAPAPPTLKDEYGPAPGSLIKVTPAPTTWYWVIIAMQALTIGLLLYMIYGPITWSPGTAQASVVPPSTTVRKAPVPTPALASRPVPPPKVILVQDRGLLSTLCYTYGNQDACKKVTVPLPSRVSPLTRYQY